MKTIGILGGLGPVATADFNQRLISIFQTKYHPIEDYEYPPMIIYDVPIKELDEKGIENSIKIFNALKKGIKTLEKDKVDFVVIDCNTVHYYINKLRKITKIPIISIIEEVLQEAKNKKYKTLGLIGAQTTIDKGIYDKISKKSKIDIIHPTKHQEEMITSTILRVMGGKNNRKDVTNLMEVIQNMKEKDAQAVIIGCTELSIPVRNQKFKIPILDSTEILANAAIKYSKFSST